MNAPTLRGHVEQVGAKRPLGGFAMLLIYVLALAVWFSIKPAGVAWTWVFLILFVASVGITESIRAKARRRWRQAQGTQLAPSLAGPPRPTVNGDLASARLALCRCLGQLAGRAGAAGEGTEGVGQALAVAAQQGQDDVRGQGNAESLAAREAEVRDKEGDTALPFDRGFIPGCRSCYFFGADAAKQHMCLRFPPKAITEGTWAFPALREQTVDLWCGEWRWREDPSLSLLDWRKQSAGT